jgi:hypothetical protein
LLKRLIDLRRISLSFLDLLVVLPHYLLAQQPLIPELDVLRCLVRLKLLRLLPVVRALRLPLPRRRRLDEHLQEKPPLQLQYLRLLFLRLLFLLDDEHYFVQTHVKPPLQQPFQHFLGYLLVDLRLLPRKPVVPVPHVHRTHRIDPHRIHCIASCLDQ